MKNNLLLSLPAVLALDLALPFLLAAPYRGYSHLTQAMSVLGNKKSPCHAIYNIWLAACGAAVALNSLMLRPLLAVYSKTAAAILAVILGLYAVGGCVLPAFFPVEEKKTLPGFRHASMATALQRGLCCWLPRRRWQAFLHTGPVSACWRFFPGCAFFWPLFSSLRSSWPISPASGIRPLRGRGCGSGLPCCVCIFPWHALCLPYCKLRKKGLHLAGNCQREALFKHKPYFSAPSAFFRTVQRCGSRIYPKRKPITPPYSAEAAGFDVMGQAPSAHPTAK